ncbi:hypothetical protein ACJX0J_041505, partial [Zea mays]
PPSSLRLLFLSLAGSLRRSNHELSVSRPSQGQIHLIHFQQYWLEAERLVTQGIRYLHPEDDFCNILKMHLLTYFKETYYGKMHGRKNRYVQAHLHQKFICYPNMAYAQHKVPMFIKNSLMLSSLQITKNKIP